MLSALATVLCLLFEMPLHESRHGQSLHSVTLSCAMSGNRHDS
jgi:hypothetical protein